MLGIGESGPWFNQPRKSACRPFGTSVRRAMNGGYGGQVKDGERPAWGATRLSRWGGCRSALGRQRPVNAWKGIFRENRHASPESLERASGSSECRHHCAPTGSEASAPALPKPPRRFTNHASCQRLPRPVPRATPGQPTEQTVPRILLQSLLLTALAAVLSRLHRAGLLCAVAQGACGDTGGTAECRQVDR
jgi:hypothetical protein